MLSTSRTIPTILNSLVISVVKHIDHESVYNVLYTSNNFFFGELETYTYTITAPTYVKREIFILKSQFERVCGWKILLTKRFSSYKCARDCTQARFADSVMRCDGIWRKNNVPNVLHLKNSFVETTMVL